jgi:hypothetical protein
MKAQKFMVPNGVTLYVPIYKIHPWIKLGYPSLPSSDETNSFIISQIVDEIGNVIKECVQWKTQFRILSMRAKEALRSIGYFRPDLKQ